MGQFSGIEKVEVAGGGNYIQPGNYLLEILAIKTGKSRAPKNRPFFVAEFKAIESDSEKCPAGMNVSYMVMLDLDTGLPNVKRFAAEITNSDLSEIDEAGIEFLVSEENPMKGKLVGCQATNIPTKRGGEYTKCTFWKKDN